VPASVALWARIHLYDQDRFADHAVQALEEPAVRRALTARIVQEILVAGPPESVAIRPLVELVTATVVDSVTFREIYRDAVLRLHHDLFEEGESGPPLALTLVDAMIVITAFIEQAYPEAADELPPDLTSAFIELRQRDWTLDLATAGEGLEYLAYGLPATALVLYAAAVWLAPRRRPAMVAAGFGLVAAGVIIAVIQDFGEGIILDRVGFADNTVRQAVWDAYTGGLLGWATLMGGTGLLFAVAAHGTRERVDVRAHLASVRKVMAYSPASGAGQVLRAALFLVAGFLVVIQRERALAVMALLAGAYVIYYALSELIWVAARAEPGTAQPRPEPRRAARELGLRAGAACLLLGAAAGGAFATRNAVDTARGDIEVGPRATACNGHAELCDRRLDEVTFLGTHNSMSAADQPGWYFAHQYTGIREQLDAGVRALLLDSWYGQETGHGVRSADRNLVESKLPPGEYRDEVVAAAQRLVSLIGAVPPGSPRVAYLCHSFCELGATPLGEALAGINEFLEANPGEVVILFFQDQVSPEDTAKAFIASGLIKHVYHHPPGAPFPTLREMIEDDERVVVLADLQGGETDWYLPGFDFVQETRFDVSSPAGLDCQRGRGDERNALLALNHWVAEWPPSPATARTINRFDLLFARAGRCAAEGHHRVNLVLVNFYEIGDAALVVDVLNGVKDPPEDEAVGTG
jgi:hypothetical protein